MIKKIEIESILFYFFDKKVYVLDLIGDNDNRIDLYIHDFETTDYDEFCKEYKIPCEPDYVYSNDGLYRKEDGFFSDYYKSSFDFLCDDFNFIKEYENIKSN